MNLIKFLGKVITRPSGLELSSVLFRLLLCKKVIFQGIDENLLPNAKILYRYSSLQVITGGLSFYSILSSMLFLILSGIISIFDIDILLVVVTIFMALTSINCTGIAIYLMIKIFPGQMRYKSLIKSGQEENIVGENSCNLYNRDYILGLFAVGLPIAILFLLVVLVL